MINLKFYTPPPDLAGSGQFSKCAFCKLEPIIDGAEVYDGCIGKLQGNIWNACCGHGDKDIAYIQYVGGTCIRGEEAVKEQHNLINK